MVASRDDVQEAWLGLAAAHHAMSEHDLAGQDLGELLSRHGPVRGTTNIRLHDAITLAHGDAGWCSLSADGRLRVTLLGEAADINRVAIRLDGVSLSVRPRRRKRDGEPLCAIYHLRRSLASDTGKFRSAWRGRISWAAHSTHMSSARSKVLSRQTMAACQAGPGSPTIRTVPPCSPCRIAAAPRCASLPLTRRLRCGTPNRSRVPGAWTLPPPSFAHGLHRSRCRMPAAGICMAARSIRRWISAVRRVPRSWHDGCFLPPPGRSRRLSTCVCPRFRPMSWVFGALPKVRSGRPVSLSSSRSSAATLRPSPASTACWPRCRQRRAASWSRMHHPRTNWLTHSVDLRSAATSSCAASQAIAAFPPPQTQAFARRATATSFC